jgi:AraC family transcriptional regulator
MMIMTIEAMKMVYLSLRFRRVVFIDGIYEIAPSFCPKMGHLAMQFESRSYITEKTRLNHPMSSTPALIMSEFPDFNVPGFDIDKYNQRFYNSNVVIHASAKAVEYPLHWSPLSIKCSFNGEEHYETKQFHYAVDDDHFLVFNSGKMYSSWIDSHTEVKSLTLNIAPRFEQAALRSIKACVERQLDDPFNDKMYDHRFAERLYSNGSLVTPVVRKIAEASTGQLDGLFYELMEHLFSLEEETSLAVQQITKVKASTRTEIFERLHRAKDYIHSCYRNNLSLDEVAGVACMNTFYFLREFRKAFDITPHQFLIERRMHAAKRLLQTTDLSVTEICNNVGFSDLSSFGKLFHRYYGFSPSALRMYVKS